MARLATVDTKELEQLEKDLRVFRSRAIPFAVKDALNAQAFAARKVWRKEMDQKFILRNKFTQGSIRVRKAKGTNVQKMQSVVGSVSTYLDEQEEGASRQVNGIPMGPSAGQSKETIPRTRTVRARNKPAAVQTALTRRPRHGKRTIRNLIAIREARKSGSKLAFLHLKAKKEVQGIFRIGGGKRNPKLKLLWDLGKSTVRIPRTPTLEPTADLIRSRSAPFYVRATLRQLRRWSILGH
jgi:hypothetical protein